MNIQSNSKVVNNLTHNVTRIDEKQNYSISKVKQRFGNAVGLPGAELIIVPMAIMSVVWLSIYITGKIGNSYAFNRLKEALIPVNDK